jgi:hypothetical protein
VLNAAAMAPPIFPAPIIVIFFIVV